MTDNLSDLDDLLDILDDIELTVVRTATKQREELVPEYKTMTKTCTSCGATFTGRQKYYPGYEGDFLKEELDWCPFCFKDRLEEYWLRTGNFILESVTGTVR